MRISKVKRTFEKAYYQNYTDEIYYIAQVMKSTKPVTYRWRFYFLILYFYFSFSEP